MVLKHSWRMAWLAIYQLISHCLAMGPSCIQLPVVLFQSENTDSFTFWVAENFAIFCKSNHTPTTNAGSLLPRPLPDFILQLRRKIGRRPGTIGPWSQTLTVWLHEINKFYWVTFGIINLARSLGENEVHTKWSKQLVASCVYRDTIYWRYCSLVPRLLAVSELKMSLLQGEGLETRTVAFLKTLSEKRIECEWLFCQWETIQSEIHFPNGNKS